MPQLTRQPPTSADPRSLPDPPRRISVSRARGGKHVYELSCPSGRPPQIYAFTAPRLLTPVGRPPPRRRSSRESQRGSRTAADGPLDKRRRLGPGIVPPAKRLYCPGRAPPPVQRGPLLRRSARENPAARARACGEAGIGSGSRDGGMGAVCGGHHRRSWGLLLGVMFGEVGRGCGFCFALLCLVKGGLGGERWFVWVGNWRSEFEYRGRLSCFFSGMGRRVLLN